MLGKIKGESGSVTIEATISLSTFMFAIVTILTIVNICIVQARMSFALNMTAKEISQYSYLYSLTGFNETQDEIYQSGLEDTSDISQILSDINTVYNEIENLGNSGNQSEDNIEDILSAWENSGLDSIEKIEEAGSSLYDTFSDIASDPKNLIFGIVKLAGSEGFDLVKSRLIAAPLAHTMIQKHLVNSKDGDVNAYLKFLGVIPSPTGSYIDGLDFSKSTFFPYGSNEIKINVSYDVKIIALLPIDFTFHFNQTAITHGWVANPQAVRSNSSDAEVGYGENNTLWTNSTIEQRSSQIRSDVIQNMNSEGYEKTSGLTDVQLYNPEKNEFVMISSMNPLWSENPDNPMTVADLDEAALQESIEWLCGKMKSTTDGINKVTTKQELDGMTSKQENDCTNAANKIILVIPEDEGLKEKIESIIENANTRGIAIEVIPAYGNSTGSEEGTSSEEGAGES